MPSIIERAKNAWNAFTSRDPTKHYWDYGPGYSYKPDRVRLTRGNERSIITSIYNTISIDVAAISLRHVRLDANGQYLEDVDDGLNKCLTLRANLDQTARAFKQDVVLSLFDEGCIAIVPTNTTGDPMQGSYEINSLRTGKIIQWFPKHVKVRVYNEDIGRQQDIVLPKFMVTIIENPFYAVMNEPNSTLQRLKRKLTLLDIVDEQNSSGKLDVIIQLPYSIKTETRRKEAEKRKKDIEMQLVDSRYGIAYIDGTEKITQLNRPVENNLLKQIESLTSTLYGQLGLTAEIMNGTADEKVMLNYYNRTIEPILAAITEPMVSTFLTQNARTRGQTIKYFRDPFRLVPLNDIANTADIFCRNEIATSNEIRQVIGWKPAADPRADMLLNSNMPQDGLVPSPMESPEMMDRMPPEENPLTTPISDIRG